MYETDSAKPDELEINVWSYIAKRPKLQKIVEQAKLGNFDILFIWKYSRLARDSAFQKQIIAILESCKVRVISATEGEDKKTRLMYGFVNEIENIQRAEYTKLGLMQSFNKGAFIGRIPPGYKQTWEPPEHDKRKFAKPVIKPYPDFAIKVQEAFEMFLKTGSIIETSLATGFSKRSTAILLKNINYTGVTKYKGITRENNHPALITQQVFDKVQKKFVKKTRNTVDRLLSQRILVKRASSRKESYSNNNNNNNNNI